MTCIVISPIPVIAGVRAGVANPQGPPGRLDPAPCCTSADPGEGWEAALSDELPALPGVAGHSRPAEDALPTSSAGAATSMASPAGVCAGGPAEQSQARAVLALRTASADPGGLAHIADQHPAPPVSPGTAPSPSGTYTSSPGDLGGLGA